MPVEDVLNRPARERAVMETMKYTLDAP
jgi:hypothetical protein